MSTDRQLLAAEAFNLLPVRDEYPSDYRMFGCTPARNMVNRVDKSVPGDFKKEDALWKFTLGSRTYGGPTIAFGKIFVGTNNENPRNGRDRRGPDNDDPRGQPLDKGILMCFDLNTREFLWQAVHDKNPNGQVNDWPKEGICSTPAVENNRVYYVSNDGKVVCADIRGFADGNDGFQGEKYRSETDADIIWQLDMIKEFGVFPHNMANCSPIVVDDLLFINTSNGVDEGHINLPAPDAPSHLALHKKTGKVVWQNSSAGKNIMHGQWSNPAFGYFNGLPQVIFPGGDGWIRAFKPETGELVWKFDANPKNSKYELGGKGTRSDFIAAPVIYKERIYIATGQDPEHMSGIGHLWCIDPTGKTGDISPELVTDASVDPPKTKANPNSGAIWHYGGEEKRAFAKRDFVFGRTMNTACIADDILYIAEIEGYFHCLNARTGKKYWQFDTRSDVWGSPFYADGKLFLGTGDGDLFVFQHDPHPETLDEVELASKAHDEKDSKRIRAEVAKKVDAKYKLAKIEFDTCIRATPIVANGVLYVMTENTLYAFKKPNDR